MNRIRPVRESSEPVRKDWRSLRMRACVWTSAGREMRRGSALAPTIAPIRGSCQ